MKRKATNQGNGAGATVYTLEVCICGGPIMAEFAEANPYVIRTFEIRGDQTLARFHEAIFDAFDRYDHHLYEFQRGDGPRDPDLRRYTSPDSVPPSDALNPFPAQPKMADASRTRIDSLELTVGLGFGYLFDWGDEWWHQINVLSIERADPSVQYPRVIARTGESPPQYPDWDEDEDEQGDEE